MSVVSVDLSCKNAGDGTQTERLGGLYILDQK